MIFIACVAYKIKNNSPFVVHAQRWYLNLNKENLFGFIEGQTHFSTTWHAILSLTFN